MDSTLPSRRVVLLGIGHTNAHVLRMWRMHPLPDAQLVCISNFPYATYSGMLPGTLAGLYPPERMSIDLVRLCAAAGARLVVGHVTGIDVEQRHVVFANRPPIAYDVLSIGVGSVPARPDAESLDETVLPIKPMQTFLERLEAFLGRRRDAASSAHGVGPVGSRPFEVKIVGGGVAGTEIAFCLRHRLHRMLGGTPIRLTLIERGDRACEGLSTRARMRVERELQRQEIRVELGRAVRKVESGRVILGDSTELPADLVLWTTGAAPPPLLESVPLPKDPDGFLLTRATLQSLGSDAIFAVGDTGTIQDEQGSAIALPKAGVYAVRQGPVLSTNIRRQLDGGPLTRFVPQREFLRLLCTGDERAILDYKGFAAHGRWCWKLKDFIDGRFMDKHQDYSPMSMNAESTQRARQVDRRLPQMRCAGCGGKVPAAVLANVLARLDIVDSPGVLLGLGARDDAAILRTSPECETVVTSDFFSAPLDDPYLVGRIAAVNALSDVFAIGGRPTAAIAHVTLPGGREKAQEDLLYELLAGGVRELNGQGAALVGGHTIEGPELIVGFTMVGCVKRDQMLIKGGLRPSDVLVLTKPLGTGVLLAALMRGKLKWPWREPLLDVMLRPNAPASRRLSELDVRGVTDVTGFGLAGHLREMLAASGVAAEIDLNRIPLLPGTLEMLEAGVQSTLAPANRQIECEIDADGGVRASPRFAALFDPQTSGGLLIGVPEKNVSHLLEMLSRGGAEDVAEIGRVVPESGSEARMRVAWH